MRQFGWFIGAFAGAMMVCLLSWWLIMYQTDMLGNDRAGAADTLLLDVSFPVTDLTDAVSGDPVKLVQASLSDAVVIILGGIGCSRNQVEVLKRWNDNQTTADSTGMDIIAVYADPLMGVELSRHESLLFKKGQPGGFPDFGVRGSGVRSPIYGYPDSSSSAGTQWSYCGDVDQLILCAQVQHCSGIFRGESTFSEIMLAETRIRFLPGHPNWSP